MKDIVRFRMDGKVRFGTVQKAGKKSTLLVRMFPRTDSEGNIEMFEDSKWKTVKGVVEEEIEMMLVDAASVARGRVMKLDLHFGFWE